MSMVYLQSAQFLEACTQGDQLSVVAVVNADRVYLRSDRADFSQFTLATLREPLQPRTFATLDAAFAFCRQAVPDQSGMRVSFRVV